MAVVNEYGINGLNPSTVGGTGITAKYFPMPSGNFTSGPAVTPSSTNATGQLAVHGDSTLNGQQFSIVAAGNFEVGPGGACPTVTIEMVANTGTLLSPTYTVIASTGGFTAETNVGLFYPWQLEAIVNGDTQSGILSGYQVGVVDNVMAPAVGALSNIISGLDFSGTTSKVIGTVFGVVMRITYSVSEPGNKANLMQFQIQS
jgi:hypothetical protein